ncbi:expressed unknown protein [Seminavis robusta]|uniref:F5/8 type C domain-containing protein n=1 Tax=Seminavis robusta TaxID=568900 RepID=A0A9N8HJM0_9STRA|nr:expressed unknown protein [Seminavis robusta]|eukprot:Sro671_g184870.1 n/a (205) ;mRNA; r:23105-23719
MTVCADNINNKTKRKATSGSNDAKKSKNKKKKSTSSSKKMPNSVKSVPLAKQSEIQVMHASSTDRRCSHALENLLKLAGKTFWESEEIASPNNRREEYVQFQLHPKQQIRRIGGVEVHVSNVSVDFRVDYSLDGVTWTQGYALSALASCGMRSSFGFPPPFVARYVRVVCENKPTEENFQPKMGFKAVVFNRVAQMFEANGWEQ